MNDSQKTEICVESQDEAKDTSGPRGTYGCACVSRSGHACAELRYGYREIPEPCECLCHDWRDDDDDLG